MDDEVGTASRARITAFAGPRQRIQLLGEPGHGRWLIAPVDPTARIERRYRDGSLILATMFETPEGAVELVDFMRPRRRLPQLVRLVRGLRGRVAMRTEFILRFDYGAVVPWVERLSKLRPHATGG
jgi:GH15 family glucan-1,4-alpha-glucosidase